MIFTRINIELSLILLGLILLTGVALSQDFLVHTYDENDGLLSSTVFDVVQDSSGIMWFATRSGISAYDGLNWSSYTEVDGLPGPSYSKLKVDEEGTLWVLSSPPWFFVLYFDGSEWISYPEPDSVSAALEFTAFEVATIDRSKTIMVGTNSSGVFLFTKGTWRHITTSEGLLSQRISGIVSWRNRFYVATENGLSVIDEGIVDNRMNDELNLPTSEIVGIELEIVLEESQEKTRIWLKGAEWIGYIEDGLFELQSNDTKITLDVIFPCVSMEPDDVGGIYYGNGNYLYYFNRRLGSVVPLGTENGLISDGAISLLIDRENNVWITSFRGVSKIVSRRFANFRKEHGLFEDEVTAIVEHEPGKLIFGHNDGLTFYDGRNIQTLAFPLESITNNARGRVLDLRTDSDKNIWIAASHYGLAKIDNQGVMHWYKEKEGLKGTVTSILPDDSENLWVTTSEGLYRLREKRFIPVHATDVPQTYMRRIIQSSDGTIYISVPDRGLYVFQDEKWYNLRHPNNSAANDVYSVFVDSQLRVWVGTIAGLYILQGDSLVKYQVDDFKIDRPVYLFVEDDRNRLWFGTDNGVVRWDGKHAREYTISHGFVGRETNRAAGIVDSQGQVWIGTDMGVSCYREQFDWDYGNITLPIVELLSIEVAGQRYPPGTPIELGHDDNNLNFHFRAISFVDETLIQYMDLLEGFDTHWSLEFQSLSRQVRYTNLAPGRYRFHIKAKNAMGVWSPATSSAHIIIHKPYWMKWWFYLLIFCTIGLAFYGVARYMSGRRYAARLEKVVDERTEQLQESEKKYRTVVEQSIQGIIIAQGVPPRIVYANKPLAYILGYTVEELYALSPKEIRKLLPPEDRERFFQRYQSRLEGKPAPIQYEFRSVRKNGTVRWLEIFANRIEYGGKPAIQAAFIDISERKEAEKALRESEERYRGVYDTAPLAFVVWDRDRRVTDWNRRAEEVFGWSREEIFGQDFLQFLVPREVQSQVTRVVTDLFNGKSPSRSINENLTKSGKIILCEWNNTLLRDSEGRVVGAISLALDITEQEQLRTQLLQSEKMSSLGQLISGVAHELNNPLTGVLGFSQLLLSSEKLPEDMESSLETINREAERARKIIQNLLTFARQRRPEKKNVQINEILDRVLDLRSYEMRVSNIEVIRIFGAELPRLLVDEYQLQQVFMNIIINAEQAMIEAHGGGRLEVTTRLDEDRRIILVSFQDDGPGIVEEDLSKIFDPFFTTKPVGKGTGLGLSISYSIVQEHGGFISVVSKKGHGSTFTVELPIVKIKMPEVMSIPSLGETSVQTIEMKVLVVDDEISVVDLIKETLEREGYSVETAMRGDDAIQQIEKQEFDAIICDFKMPGRNGKDIYLYCKEKKPNLAQHFLLLTGDVVSQDIFHFFEEHNVSYLSKPFDLEEFITSVRLLLKKEN